MAAVGAGDGMAKIVATFVVMDVCRRRRGRGQRSALARLLLRTGHQREDGPAGMSVISTDMHAADTGRPVHGLR